MPKNTQHLQKYGHTNTARPFGARECAIFWSVTDAERRLLPIHISNVYTTSNLLVSVSGWINVCLSIMCVCAGESVCLHVSPAWLAGNGTNTHTHTHRNQRPAPSLALNGISGTLRNYSNIHRHITYIVYVFRCWSTCVSRTSKTQHTKPTHSQPVSCSYAARGQVD